MGAMSDSGVAMGDGGGISSEAASAVDGGGDSSGGTGGMGQFTITFDATVIPFGPEHAGLTAYAELVDTTGGMKMRVGDIYSSPMTKTGYAKWIWPNVAVAGVIWYFVKWRQAGKKELKRALPVTPSSDN